GPPRPASARPESADSPLPASADGPPRLPKLEWENSVRTSWTRQTARGGIALRRKPPPRAAPIGIDSRSGPRYCTLRRSRARVPRRRQRRFVIRMVGHFLHVLRVPDLVLPVQHEDRAALDPELLDQRAVVGAERAVLVVGEHLHLVHPERSAP